MLIMWIGLIVKRWIDIGRWLYFGIEFVIKYLVIVVRVIVSLVWKIHCGYIIT